MQKRLLWIALFSCIALLATTSPPALAQMRWAALLENGEIVEGNALSEWNVAGAHPKIDGREILHDENPFLWVRDRHPDRHPQAPPQAYVEFSQGDILPGEVVGWRSGPPSPYEVQGEYFIVRTPEMMGLGADNHQPEVRIAPKYVRRIVWQKKPRLAYQPGTLFYRNGRQLEFRSWRGGIEGISVLTSGGLQHVPLEEIAELHLPSPDFWDSYCDEIAALLPNGDGRLCTIRTMAGMIATGSLSQLQVRPGAPADQPDQWIHGIQPIWSLDPLWIRGVTVWLRQSYKPTELPLNKLLPVEKVDLDLLGAAPWEWQRDMNVQGGRLVAGAQSYGWGYGVHAPSELEFLLPAAAISFQASVAIDDTTGDGGCVLASVHAGHDGRVLFESPLLLGSGETAAIGPLDLTGLRVVEGYKSLVLVVDPAVEERPEGADPLDIRDHADWLDPRIQLDPAMLAAALEPRLPPPVKAWEGWQVAMTDPAAFTLAHAQVDASVLTSHSHFAYATDDVAAGVVLSRDLRPTSTERWLLATVHTSTAEPARLEVRANGLPLGSYDIPALPTFQQGATSILVPLSPLGGQETRLEIVPRPRLGATTAPPLVWTSLRIVDQLPMVYSIFEDNPRLLTRESLAACEIIEDPALAHSGEAALQVPAGQTIELKFPSPISVDADPQWGEYRYVRFAIKKQGGMAGIEFIGSGEGEDRTLAYEAGAGNAVQEDSVRVWTLQLGGDWIVITRDLYSDFGKVELTGLRITATEGDFALFDQILLSRRSDGFDTLPPPPSAEFLSLVELMQQADPATLDTLAATAHLVVDGMHSMALGVDPEGYLVTSGEFAGGVGREAAVYFRDRPQTRAVVHGIDRDHNLALWKIADAGPWPAVNLAQAPATTATPAVMLALEGGEEWRPLSITLTELGPADARYTTAALDPPGGTMPWGGALVGLDGQVLGVARGRKPDGLPAYTQASVLAAQLARLKQGGAYGSWEPQTTPQLGLTLTPVEGGLQVTAVDGNLPAGAIGIQVNDILTKFDGQAVTTQEQYDALLRQRDARQVLTLELKRGEEVLTLTPTLLPLPL